MFKSREVFTHLIKTFKNRVRVYFYFPTKNMGRPVNFAGTFHLKPKNCTRCNNRLLYRGFSMRI